MDNLPIHHGHRVKENTETKTHKHTQQNRSDPHPLLAAQAGDINNTSSAIFFSQSSFLHSFLSSLIQQVNLLPPPLLQQVDWQHFMSCILIKKPEPTQPDHQVNHFDLTWSSGQVRNLNSTAFYWLQRLPVRLSDHMMGNPETEPSSSHCHTTTESSDRRYFVKRQCCV